MSRCPVVRFGGIDLGELPLRVHAQLREVAATHAIECREIVLELAHVCPRLVQNASRFGARFTYHQLCLFFRLRLHLSAKLLCRNESFVDCLVTLTERAKLFVEATRLLLEVGIEAADALELVRHLLAKLIDALGIVTTERPSELVTTNVEWREVKRFVDHSRSPKRIVPSR